MARPLTRTQLCALLGVSAKSLYLWERARMIPRPARDRRGWRSYAPRDVERIRRFLGGPARGRAARDSAPTETAATRGVALPARGAGASRALEGLSARNQLRGRVTAIRGDGVLAEVTVRLGDGQDVVAVVTRRSVKRLGLRVGGEAVAIIKSTEVMLYS